MNPQNYEPEARARVLALRTPLSEWVSCMNRSATVDQQMRHRSITVSIGAGTKFARADRDRVLPLTLTLHRTLIGACEQLRGRLTIPRERREPRDRQRARRTRRLRNLWLITCCWNRRVIACTVVGCLLSGERGPSGSWKTTANSSPPMRHTLLVGLVTLRNRPTTSDGSHSPRRAPSRHYTLEVVDVEH